MSSVEPNVGLARDEMAQRVAADIPDGAYVNLGIGIPELITKFVPEGREFIYHTENGLLGMGPPCPMASLGRLQLDRRPYFLAHFCSPRQHAGAHV